MKFPFLIFFCIVLFLSGCEPVNTVNPDGILGIGESCVNEWEGIEYQLTRQGPLSETVVDESTVYDFEKDAFGQPVVTVSGHLKDTLFLSMGECVSNGHIDTKPGGFRRYRRIAIPLKEGKNTYKPQLSRDPYGAVITGFSMPELIGEVTPFRYLEIENAGCFDDCEVSRIVVTCPFDDDASFFQSDNAALNEVWEFCKYSMKATSFAGYYVDGDRERTPYEADALINQLGHYGVDSYYPIARRTCQYLLENPTWPTEWILQTILIAWNDCLYSGSTDLIAKNYDLLKAHALFDLVDAGTGLITTLTNQTPRFLASIHRKSEIVDIVDWPHSSAEGAISQDDGYVYSSFNTVVNAYHYQAVKALSKIAAALGKQDDASSYDAYAASFKEVFNAAFFDRERGIYVDGKGENHASLHANMFPLAFGLIPDGQVAGVADYVCSRGMACSVYGAQFLLEALYRAGKADKALDYMVSTEKRSWMNMMREGSTISMEAWGNECKPNQDWNHAWGAAPANIIPFQLLGIRPIEPGFSSIIVQPQIGWLKDVYAMVPTPKGRISMHLTPTVLEMALPLGVSAQVCIPVPFPKYEVLLNGSPVHTMEQDGFILLENPVSRNCKIQIKET